MDHDNLTLASPAGMLCHVLKAYSAHPVDLTHAALEKLGLPADPANVTGAHHAVQAVLTWLGRSGARPGVDTRDVVDVLAYLNLTDQPAAREVADGAIAQLLAWIWGDPVCTATGRRAAIAGQLGYTWDTDDGYATGPYNRTWL